MTQRSSDAEETPPVELLRRVLDERVEVKLHLLQHYAEMARLLAAEIMEEEVETLAIEHYSRDKPRSGRYRS